MEELASRVVDDTENQDISQEEKVKLLYRYFYALKGQVIAEVDIDEIVRGIKSKWWRENLSKIPPEGIKVSEINIAIEGQIKQKHIKDLASKILVPKKNDKEGELTEPKKAQLTELEKAQLTELEKAQLVCVYYWLKKGIDIPEGTNLDELDLIETVYKKGWETFLKDIPEGDIVASQFSDIINEAQTILKILPTEGENNPFEGMERGELSNEAIERRKEFIQSILATQESIGEVEGEEPRDSARRELKVLLSDFLSKPKNLEEIRRKMNKAAIKWVRLSEVSRLSNEGLKREIDKKRRLDKKIADLSVAIDSTLDKEGNIVDESGYEKTLKELEDFIQKNTKEYELTERFEGLLKLMLDYSPEYKTGVKKLIKILGILKTYSIDVSRIPVTTVVDGERRPTKIRDVCNKEQNATIRGEELKKRLTLLGISDDYEIGERISAIRRAISSKPNKVAIEDIIELAELGVLGDKTKPKTATVKREEEPEIEEHTVGKILFGSPTYQKFYEELRNRGKVSKLPEIFNALNHSKIVQREVDAIMGK